MKNQIEVLAPLASFAAHGNQQAGPQDGAWTIFLGPRAPFLGTRAPSWDPGPLPIPADWKWRAGLVRRLGVNTADGSPHLQPGGPLGPLGPKVWLN